MRADLSVHLLDKVATHTLCQDALKSTEDRPHLDVQG